MKAPKSKHPASARRRRIGWSLRVPKSGAVKLSATMLDKLGAWPGDVLAVYARQFSTHKEIVLRILPHGLTPAEIRKSTKSKSSK